MSFFYMVTAVVLISLGQILQKLAAMRMDTRTGVASAVRSLLQTAQFYEAVAVMFLGLFAWLLALSDLDVSRAYPILGTSFVLTTIFSALILKEKISLRNWIGVLLISAGAAIMVSS